MLQFSPGIHTIMMNRILTTSHLISITSVRLAVGSNKGAETKFFVTIRRPASLLNRVYEIGT